MQISHKLEMEQTGLRTRGSWDGNEPREQRKKIQEHDDSKRVKPYADGARP